MLANISVAIALVSPLFLIFAVVGLIWPSLFKNKKTGVAPRRALLFFGGVAGAVFTLLLAVSIFPGKEDRAKAASAAASSEVAALAAAASAVSSSPTDATQRVSLEMTPQAFRVAYNRLVSSLDGNYTLAEIDIVHDAVYDGFQQVVGRNVELAGTINKDDGSLRELMVRVGNDDPGKMLKSVAALVAIAQAVNPSATSQEIAGTVVSMTQLAMEHRKDAKAIARPVGKQNYAVILSDTAGLLFAISPR